MPALFMGNKTAQKIDIKKFFRSGSTRKQKVERFRSLCLKNARKTSLLKSLASVLIITMNLLELTTSSSLVSWTTDLK